MKAKNLTLQKIITLIICIILACGCFSFFDAKAVNAQEGEKETLYFDYSKSQNVFSVSTDILGEVESAKIVESSTNILNGNISVNNKQIKINNTDTLKGYTLGEEYTLKVTTTESEYLFNIIFVTKAITTAQDCKVLDIATTTTIVDGYYVLLNDIDLGDKVFNVHQGVFDSKNVNTNGFAGTFNGLGHNITFVANNNGFFGRLIKNAKVINTGFTNVRFDFNKDYTRADDQTNTCPILTQYCGFSSGEKGLVENCYFHTDEDIQGGAISYYGRTTDKLETKNILIKYGTLNSFLDINGYGLGCFISNHVDVWASSTRENVIKDVYVISGYPLGVYAKTAVINEDTKKLLADKFNAGQTPNYYIRTYASNWGATDDLSSGIRVFKNIKQYIDYNAMSADTANDFSSFDSKYWNTNNGILSWKNLESVKEIKFSTSASNSKDNINLDASTMGVSTNKNTVKFYLAENFVKIEDAVITATMLDSYGSYTYVTDTVAITGSGTNEVVATAVKDGVGRIKLTCTYEDASYEFIIKLTVRNTNVSNGTAGEDVSPTPPDTSGGAGEANPSVPPESVGGEQTTPDSGASCSTNVSINNVIVVTFIAFCLGAITISIKKKIN